MNISTEQRKLAKGQGFLSNRDGCCFSMRVITENGVLNSKQMKNLSEAAEKFGNGQITFTSRLTVELPGIRYEDIEKVKVHIKKEGMSAGGTGSKVRPVVACKGTVCTNGLFDTQEMGTEIHKRFYEGYRHVTLPHKFKIAVGGCPNSCVKPDLNDLGIIGQMVPNFLPDKCRGCGKCSVKISCPVNAADVVKGKLIVDSGLCINCGSCIDKCPFGTVPDGSMGFKVCVGGRWGKKIRMGTPLKRIFTREEAMDVVEKAILLFKWKGESGERLASTIDRLGIETVEEMLISDRLLNIKDQLLNIKTIGGASC
ncbi:MAG: 4Fe-4S binding protein [Sedimentibacter sp.]|uniref:4Fe-4S dicluster domain-containing protein n=1 Tax=Sedimentibacter sp. TaxID=1960295 RepID=UPI003157FB1B